MAEGCGLGGGLTVLAGDVGAVCVPAWVPVVLVTAVAVGSPVAAVCLRDRVLGPALGALVAAEAAVAAVPWVLAVSCFREVLVATAAVAVVTRGPVPCLVEDTGAVVVFLAAAVSDGMAGVAAWPAVLGLSAGAVDGGAAPAWAATGWPAAGAACSCSVVCSVVLWLVGVV